MDKDDSLSSAPHFLRVARRLALVAGVAATGLGFVASAHARNPKGDPEPSDTSSSSSGGSEPTLPSPTIPQLFPNSCGPLLPPDFA